MGKTAHLFGWDQKLNSQNTSNWSKKTIQEHLDDMIMHNVYKVYQKKHF